VTERAVDRPLCDRAAGAISDVARNAIYAVADDPAVLLDALSEAILNLLAAGYAASRDSLPTGGR